MTEKLAKELDTQKNEKKHPLPPPTLQQMTAMTNQERDAYRNAYMENYVPPPGKKLVMFTTGFASTSFPKPVLEDVEEVRRQCLSGQRKPQFDEKHLTWKYAPMVQHHYDRCPCTACQSISLKLKTLMAKKRYIEEFYSRDHLIQYAVQTGKLSKPRHDTG